MQLFISHQSALEYWRNCSTRPAQSPVQIAPQHTPSLAAHEAEWLGQHWGITAPVHVCVAAQGKMRRPSTIICHLEKAPVEGAGYLHLGKNTYVASPELTAVQLAKLVSTAPSPAAPPLGSPAMRNKLPGVMLAVVLCEMMGSYRLNAAEPNGFVEATPLFKRRALEELLANNKRFPGRCSLEFAVEHALEASASPAETALALLETLPLSCGGMGLAQRPLLNATVQASFKQHSRMLRPDQLFADAGIVVEYNGSYHVGERANADERRRLELESSGYTVKSINREQLFDASALDEALRPLQNKVGTSGRRPADHEARRADLRAVVFEACNTRCAENVGAFLPAGLAPAAS